MTFRKWIKFYTGTSLALLVLFSEGAQGTRRIIATREAPAEHHHPRDTYTERVVEGWTVRVNDELLTTRPLLGDEVLKLLGVKLFEIRRVLPAAAVKHLQKVPIWVEVEDRQRRHRGAVYHPSVEWLAAHGYSPLKGRSIELANAQDFIDWTRDQPCMLLHEMAHAYHHQVLGYSQPDVIKAYKRALDSKSYERVLRSSGLTERAYALTDEREYFAELTESYFGTNDFYPFVKAELKRHDSVGYETLERLWGGSK